MPNKRLLSVYLILLVDVLGFTIIFPLLPFYGEHFGASTVAVGSLGTIYALCQLVAGPLLGALSDRWGRRPVLLISQIGTFVSFLLLAFAPSFWWLCLARGVDGMTAGNISVAHAYTADVTSPAERGRAFALMSTVFGVGFVLGPSLSGVLVRFGFRVPILVAAGLSLSSLLLTYLYLQESGTRMAATRDLYPWSRLLALFRDRSVRPRFIQFTLFAIAFSFYFFGLPLFVERRFTFAGHAFGPREMGLLFLLSGAVSLVIQVSLARRWLAQYGEEAIVSGAWMLAGAGYALLAVAGRISLLLLAIVVIAVANALLRPGLTGLISRRTSSREQGATMGALQSLYSLADLIAPMAAGWMIGHEWLTFWGLLMSLIFVLGAGMRLESRGREVWPA